MTVIPHWLRRAACGLCLAVLCCLSGAPVTAQTADQELETPVRAYGLAGAQIFSAYCASCHGESGAGDGPVLQDRETAMIDFRDPAALALDRSPLLWQQVTADGRMDRLMPPWKNQLTQEQMWDAVAFLWQLSTSAEELAQGAAVWQSLGSDADMPVMGQQTLALALAEWQASAPAGIDKEAWRQLSAGELAAAYRHLQAQTLIPSWAPLLGEGQGTVAVQVQPLSPGLELPSELAVRLKAQIGHLPAGEWTNTTDWTRGLLAFQDLDTSPRIAYRAEVEWDGQKFQSESVSLAAEDNAAELEVEVFAVSNTQAVVTIAQLQILLALSEGQVLIGQQALAANSLPYVFTGRQEGLSKPVTVEIPLFPGATEVTLAEEDGTRFETGENKIYDRAPLFPLPKGTWSTLGYGLPLPAPGDTWVQIWPYPTSDITVLVPQREDLQAEIAGFEFGGTQEIGGIVHARWHADALPDGQLAIRFNAAPTVASDMAQMPPWMPWALAMFLLLLMATFVAFTGTRRRFSHRRANEK